MKNVILGFIFAVALTACFEGKLDEKGVYQPSQTEKVLVQITETLRQVATASAIAGTVAPVTAPATGPIGAGAGLLATITGLGWAWLERRNKRKLGVQNETLVEELAVYKQAATEIVKGVEDFKSTLPEHGDKDRQGSLASKLSSAMSSGSKALIKGIKAQAV